MPRLLLVDRLPAGLEIGQIPPTLVSRRDRPHRIAFVPLL